MVREHAHSDKEGLQNVGAHRRGTSVREWTTDEILLAQASQRLRRRHVARRVTYVKLPSQAGDHFVEQTLHALVRQRCKRHCLVGDGLVGLNI